MIKDYGITMFFYNNKIVTEQPKTMKDFYDLLNKYESKGRTNLLDGPEEVVPLALMALGLDPNTSDENDFDQVRDFLLSIRKGVTTISSFGYINDGIAGKIILGQGWNGDVRRIVEGRKAQGDITAVLPEEASEIWADNWCVPADAPHPVAAHDWIDWLLQPSTAVAEMNYHNYPIPIPDALDQVPAELEGRPALQRAVPVHGQLQVRPEREPAGRAGADEDLHGVQGRLMTQTKVELEPSPAARRARPPSEPRRGRSFKPRYPAWLVLPSMVYYLIFFLGAMAILVAFSLATQTGFGEISYGFSFAQFKDVLDSLYLNIFVRTMVMAFLGTALTIAVGYPVAYWMARYLSTYKMLALLLIVVPFWTSFLIRTYALKIILDPQGYLATDLRHRHHVHEVRGRSGPRLQLPAAVHPARVRDAGAHGLDARRGGERPGGVAAQGVPADHPAAHAARRRDGRAAGPHPDDGRVHHPQHPRRREVRCSSATSSATSSTRRRTSRSARPWRSR